ncbi:MAG: hypothetical protein Q7R69_00050, partial [bacterium]|nr:hypothetical protein [bacterium]
MKNEAENWLSMSEAAHHVPYSAEYLSLLARKKKLTSKKIGNAWYTTKPVLDDYMKKQMIRAQVQNGNFRSLESSQSPHTDFNKYEEQSSVENKTEKVSSNTVIPDIGLILERVIDKKFHSRFSPFKVVLSSRLLIAATLASLLLLALLPVPIVFGFFDKSFNFVRDSINDANTVLGFRPGTHQNEILLLDSEGNVAIMGHIETEGQLRSYIQDGIAPIVVDSKTLVKNLNAEFIGGASSTDFTLAFVTANGSMTRENVKLEGNVEVGKTLLVRGATKLLSTLEVGGDLKVIGRAYFEDIVTTQSDLVVKGNLDIQKNVSIRGGLEVGSAVIAMSGSFGSLGVLGSFSAGGKITLGNPDEVFIIDAKNVTLNAAGHAFFNSSVGAPRVSATSFDATNSTTSNATSTNFFTNTFTSLFSTITSLIADDITVGALTATNSTSTNSTTTNAIITNATTTNLAVSDNLFTSLTLGSVPFIGASGLLTQNNADFFWDDATSRLGIGTNTPESTFNIIQTTNGVNIFNARRITDVAPSGDFIEYTNAAGDEVLFRVDNSGNLLAGGIITTGSQTITSTSQPQFRVQYDASNEWTSSVGSTGTTTFAFNGTTPRAIFIPASDRTDTFQFQNAAGLAVLSIDTTNQRVGVSTTSPWAKFSIGTHNLSTTLPAFVIASSSDAVATTTQFIVTNGNVGIGTTSPSATLAINPASDTRSLYIEDQDGSPSVAVATIRRPNNNSSPAISNALLRLIDHSSNYPLSIEDHSGNSLLAVRGNGNVGIGTTSPYAKLSVVGGTSGTVIAADAITGFTGNLLDLKVASTTKFSINQAGDIFSSGSTTLQNFTFANATGTSATSTNLFSTNFEAINASTTNLLTQNILSYASSTFQNLTFLNSTSTNATTTNFFSTTASSTNLYSSLLTVGGTGLVVDSSRNVGIGTTTPWGLLSVNPNGISGPSFVVGSSTATNFIVTNVGNVGIGTTSPYARFALHAGALDTYNANLFLVSSSTAAFSTTTLFSIDALGLATIKNLLVTSSSTFQNATSTNLFSTTASSTNLYSALLNSGSATFANLLVKASSTLQNFTFNNATGTSATSTNLFSTTASSTDLYSTLLTVGGTGLVVDSSRNVGIGTAGPSFKLDVNGSIRSGSTVASHFYNATYSVPVSTAVTINLYDGVSILQAGYQYRIKLVTQITGTPTGAVYIVYRTAVGTWVARMVSANGTTSNHPLLQVSGTSVQIYHNHATLTYSIGVFVEGFNDGNTSGPSDATFFGLEGAMTNLSGNVGIGTTSPDTSLDVVKTGSGKTWATTAGTVALFDRSSTAGAAAYISVISGNTGLARLQLGDTDSEAQGLVQYNNSLSALSLWTSALQRMTIDSSGNVGIGTTTPWGKLSVTQTGTAGAPAFIVEDSASPDTSPFIIDQT